MGLHVLAYIPPPAGLAGGPVDLYALAIEVMAALLLLLADDGQAADAERPRA